MLRGYSQSFAAKCEEINLDTGKEMHDEETAVNDAIPDEDVKTTPEETEAASPADENNADELVVDDSVDDQKKSSMSQEEAYAAFQREKRKRKSKNTENEELKSRLEQQESTIQELKAQVGTITKGGPPTLENCEYDEEKFQEATRNYYSKEVKTESSPKPKADAGLTPEQEKQRDQAEFYLYQKEQDLTAKMPNYSEDKEAVVKTLAEKGYTDTDGALMYLSSVARQKGVDIAKVVVAMAKVPSIIDDIANAGASDIAVADVLDSAAKRIKPRSQLKIDTQPEPNINSSGPIDSSAGGVEKLRQQWVKNPTAGNHAKYNQAKRKLKAKDNG